MRSTSFLPTAVGLVVLAAACTRGAARAADDFVNFETPQVTPLALSPDGRWLAACNTPDNRIELFDLESGTAPFPAGSIPVGVDPVTVRFRTGSEAWVVNQLSDSISIVDVENRTVVATLSTADEPADVVFAGTPSRAFVSCSSVDRILVYDPADLTKAPQVIAIEGEEPRAMGVSPDGGSVHVAIFESGNGSTMLGGGDDPDTNILAFPPNVVSDPRGPYGGVNPPPNNGGGFLPPRNGSAGTPPKVGLIVKKDADGTWRDDNGADWSDFVSGPLAPASGRPVGWNLIDHDVATIDTATLTVSYAGRMMNACMAIGVNPATGQVAIVGTDGTNEIRFEPVINGTFLRVLIGLLDPSAPADAGVRDLNAGHLDYTSPTVPQDVRNLSIGDPRGIAWNATGTRAYVTGMGSNNVIVVDPTGTRSGLAPSIEVGEGPTGVVCDDARTRLYVLNRFENSLSTIDLTTEAEIARTAFHDPTPPAIQIGRRHLYDTHRTSGLGSVSCASCHIDSRTDRLGWDLGDPSGSLKKVQAGTHNLGGGVPGLNNNFTDFHPMKGPMTTQTLQDIIGHEPHHWRGDRNGIEEFNPAFVHLLGDDAMLTPAEMQEFEDYLTTIHFPPNPFRSLENGLPTDLPLEGHFTSGRFAPAGQPMPNGNARRALEQSYIPLGRAIDQGTFACVTCHTLPTGAGTDHVFNILTLSFLPINPGPNGERHHALVSVDGSSQRAFKVPQLRNLYDKVGFETTQPTSRAGFGFAHDGSVDSLSRFLSEPAFTPNNDQEVADLVALMLSFSGSGFGDRVEAFQPPGTASKDAHAAVGKQVTLTSDAPGPERELLARLLAIADTGGIELIAKGNVSDAPRGWIHLGESLMQSDAANAIEDVAAVLARATPGQPVTFTAVPPGTGFRFGVERDRDGLLDHDEIRDLVPSVAGVQNPFDPARLDATGNDGSLTPDGVPDGANDFDGDGATNAEEFAAGTNPVDNLVTELPLNISIDWIAAGESVLLEWDAPPGSEFEILYSSDLVAWTQSADSPMSAGSDGGRMQWMDSGPPATDRPPAGAPQRFYIVNRLR